MPSRHVRFELDQETIKINHEIAECATCERQISQTNGGKLDHCPHRNIVSILSNGKRFNTRRVQRKRRIDSINSLRHTALSTRRTGHSETEVPRWTFSLLIPRPERRYSSLNIWRDYKARWKAISGRLRRSIAGHYASTQFSGDSEKLFGIVKKFKRLLDVHASVYAHALPTIRVSPSSGNGKINRYRILWRINCAKPLKRHRVRRPC